MSTTDAARIALNLRLASIYGDTQDIRRALEAGADPNEVPHKGKNGPLHLAALHKHPEAVTILLSAGAHVDLRTTGSQQFTPLILASAGYGMNKKSRRTRHAVVLALIKAGADVNARDGPGLRPFSGALFYGHRFMLLDLLRAGAAVHTTNVERKARNTSAWALVAASL